MRRLFSDFALVRLFLCAPAEHTVEADAATCRALRGALLAAHVFTSSNYCLGTTFRSSLHLCHVSACCVGRCAVLRHLNHLASTAELVQQKHRIERRRSLFLIC